MTHTHRHTLNTLQAQIILFLAIPNSIQEVTFIVILVLACLLRMIQVAYLLWRQVSVDVFFVDWEKPHDVGSVNTTTHPSTSNGGTVAPSVSIWRTYFLTNEWNEIQSFRKISPTFVLFAVLFFLEVVGLKNLAEKSPAAHVTTSDERFSAPHSIVLRFVLVAMLFTVLAGLTVSGGDHTPLSHSLGCYLILLLEIVYGTDL